MADKTPDATEGGDSSLTSGARRSGLDRLRAARGGATTEPTARDRPTDDSRDTAGSGSGPGERKVGSTALLEGERSREATRPIEGPVDPDRADADGVEDTDAAPGTGGRRARRRRATAEGAADSTSATRRGRRPAAGRPTATQAGRPSRAQLVTMLVLGLLVVGLLVPVIAMRHRVVGESKEDKAVTSLINKQVDAQAAARRFAVTFFSPDYKTIDNYNNEVAAASTGSWQSDFNGKRGQLKSLLTQVQSQATGRVLESGVSKVSDNNVSVLLVVDQDVKNTTSKGKTVTNRYRVRLTMLKTAKGWLVSNVEPV